MRVDQIVRAEALFARAQTVVVGAEREKVANQELQRTLEQVIADARAGLTSIPSPGAPWDANKNYTVGDEVTDEGIVYIASHYSRGMKPNDNPRRWDIKPEIATYPDWDSFEDMHQFAVGARVAYVDKNWECIDPCTKNALMKPNRAGSTKWVEIG